MVINSQIKYKVQSSGNGCKSTACANVLTQQHLFSILHRKHSTIFISLQTNQLGFKLMNSSLKKAFKKIVFTWCNLFVHSGLEWCRSFGLLRPHSVSSGDIVPAWSVFLAPPSLQNFVSLWFLPRGGGIWMETSRDGACQRMKADVLPEPQGRNTFVPEFTAGHVGFVLALHFIIKSNLLDHIQRTVRIEDLIRGMAHLFFDLKWK